LNKLNDLLFIAKNKTIYYKDLNTNIDDFKNDFSKKLTKHDLQNHKYDLLIDEYRGELANYLDITRTSGSTGMFVEVLWQPKELLKSNLCLWRLRHLYYNIKPTLKHLTFHSSVYEGNRVANIEKVYMDKSGKILSLSKFHLNECNFSEYVDLIKKFQPRWIFTQPSTLLRLIDYIDKFQLTCHEVFPNIQYIELTGEMCLSSVKELIRQRFNVPVANMYGCNEVNSIAYECPNGHMHVVDSNVFIKILPETEFSTRGKILITSLINKTMPIIDYDLNDTIEIDESVSCSYSNSTVINVLVGRRHDEVCLPSGQYVSSLDFLYCIEKTNENMNNIIKQFQFRINKRGNKLMLYIDKKNSKWENAIKDEFNKYYCTLHDNYQRDFNVCITYHVLPSSGKLKSEIFVYES